MKEAPGGGGEKSISPCDCLHQKTIRMLSYIRKELLGGGNEGLLKTAHQIGTVGADPAGDCHPASCLSHFSGMEADWCLYRV